MQETVSYLDLKQLTDEALEAIGLSDTDREIVREVLLFAELRGNNQGLIKIPLKAVQPSAEATPMVIEHPFPAVAHIKGNGQLGMVVMDRAVDVVTNAATQCGIGWQRPARQLRRVPSAISQRNLRKPERSGS